MATEEQTPPKQKRKDFFISYTSTDRAWAEWIAWQLEEMGYRTVLQAWDFHAGGNFVLDMDSATKQAERTIAVLSPEYFASTFTPSEWAAAFGRDPKGEQGLLIPVRVRLCDVEGLLGQIVYVDLVDRAEQEAMAVLQAEVQRQRRKPLSAPTFPFHPSILRRDRFPGASPPLLGQRESEVSSPQHPATHADPDWERMLRRLKRSYKELLDQSLHGIAWVELGLASRPDMVSNVTNLLFRLPQGGERLLAPGTSLLDTFNKAEEELLILGAPGAGKSTLLLKLAQQLVDRAFADPSQPLPVIFQFSSWAVGKSALTDWMTEQLSRTYDVPRQLSERWVQQGRLLPLLDGLDEVEAAARPTCIAAINDYHRTQTHLTPLVVCSRQTEYESAAKREERLALQCAVIVQPLSDKQIEAYLRTAGPSFAGVRAALHQNPALWELATTPLMLSVLLLTYRDTSTEEITKPATDLERQVWADYVNRMVQEKGNEVRYPLKQTHHWLTYLAQQMRAHQQTIFYAEYLQADWLTSKQQRISAWLSTRVPAILLGVLISILTLLAFSPSIYTIASLLQTGFIGGFLGGWLSQYGSVRSASYQRNVPIKSFFGVTSSLLLGLLIGASFGFNFGNNYGWGDWLRDGVIYGSLVGLGGWLFYCFLPRKSHLSVALPTRLNRHRFLCGAVFFGAAISLSSGLSGVQRAGLGILLDGNMISNMLRIITLAGILFGWLGYGLSAGVTSLIVGIILESNQETLRLAERLHWNRRMLFSIKHLYKSELLFLGLLLLFGLSYGLLGGLSISVISPIHFNLRAAWGIGAGFGCGYALGYWLLFGLYQGIVQEHLEDEDRYWFNQGIRRSLWNGAIISSISGTIIAGVNILSNGLGTGLAYSSQYGWSYGLSQGLSQGWIATRDSGWFFLAGGLVMWAMIGGLTVLRHYVIRWILARSHRFPWRAQAFLDDATTRILLRRVGGGYSFTHRRLQDYFANAVVPPSQN